MQSAQKCAVPTRMAIWRHCVTTQKCRTWALNRKPRLFKFAFFANMASDHASASLYFVGYNEGQPGRDGALCSPSRVRSSEGW